MHLAYRFAAVPSLMICFGACSVPDKKAASPDGGPPDVGDAKPPDDNEAPDTALDEAPAAFSNTSQVTFRFSSHEAGATFSCLVDGKEVVPPCQSPYVLTLRDGAHSFSVRALDPAGNRDDTPAEHLWTIDTVAPDTSVVAGPPGADNSVMPKFTFRSSEANVTFDCSLDNAGYVPCTSGASFGPVGDGPHAFAVRARDRAGNADASPAIYPWTVNTSTPDTDILSGPADASASASTTAAFRFVSPDAGAGATFECALDDGGFIACTSPQSYSDLGEGPHSFAVRVRDAVGNLDPTPADRSWTVDRTPPNTTIVTGPSGVMAVASASVTFTANEPDAAFGCSLDGGAFASCTSPANLPGLAQGSHTFAVRAVDAAGNTDTSPATGSWTVDTVFPGIAFVTGPANNSTVGPRVVLGFTVTEGVVACSLDSAAFGACAGPIAVNLPAGAHQFAVRATDAAGNTTTVSRAWTIACSGPDATGAAGVLHLDDAGQDLTNAVAGGASAMLGDTLDAEPGDAAPLAAARFAGGLAFSAAASQHVAWPIALPAMPDLTLELWASPASVTGTRDLVVSGDGRVALRVAAASPTTVVFSISIGEGGEAGATRTVTSAAVAAGAWHHVLASLQQPSLRLWVDGVRTELATVQLATPPALDALRLGGQGDTAYEGALDELWLAQTAITSEEPALARYCPL
jgi:hypothetical protein